MMPVTFKSRIPWQQALFLALELRKLLLEAGMERVEICGSIRRCKPDVGDIDLVVKGDIGSLRVSADWAWVEGGATKATLNFRGTQVNLLRSDDDSWGAAMLYFTGPHDYNIWYRRMAKGRGMLLNEKGLFDGGGRRIAGRTEDEIYAALGKNYKDPSNRGR